MTAKCGPSTRNSRCSDRLGCSSDCGSVRGRCSRRSINIQPISTATERKLIAVASNIAFCSGSSIRKQTVTAEALIAIFHTSVVELSRGARSDTCFDSHVSQRGRSAIERSIVVIIRHTAHISPTGRESGGSRCRRNPGSCCAGRIGVGKICGRSGTRSRGEDVVLSSVVETPVRPIQGRSIESGNVVSFCLVNVLKR